jgi:hypothetical protein
MIQITLIIIIMKLIYPKLIANKIEVCLNWKMSLFLVTSNTSITIIFNIQLLFIKIKC